MAATGKFLAFWGALATTALTFAQDDRFFTIGLEAKLHGRDSQSRKVGVPFPFPDFFLPPGETQGSLETVDAGSHAEISRISLFLEGRFNRLVSARVKVDGVDKYDRNPTSTDNELDVDEAWVMFGDKTPSDLAPDQPSRYLKLGKFEKFERQNDRNLESYGLASTSFNRFEDAGVELGADIGRVFYARLSYTVGNPVFLRDSNALAGDNGADGTNPFENPFPVPELKSGFTMFYDAEIEDYDFDNGELGAGLGFRFENQDTGNLVNLLLYGYRRDLADSVDITGSFYGGDLDLLRGPGDAGGLPLEGDEKQEYGANLWLYLGAFSGFVQYVDSEIAGLGSVVYETELAYAWETPWTWGAGGRPLLGLITPAARYSRADPDFTGDAMVFPGPNLWWEWEKIDAGLTIHIIPDLTLAVEYASNQFLRGGRWLHYDEFLATLSWRWFSGDRLGL